jgi:hypothetical protein
MALYRPNTNYHYYFLNAIIAEQEQFSLDESHNVKHVYLKEKFLFETCCMFILS